MFCDPVAFSGQTHQISAIKIERPWMQASGRKINNAPFLDVYQSQNSCYNHSRIGVTCSAEPA